jgi:hypothetical protein
VTKKVNSGSQTPPPQPPSDEPAVAGLRGVSARDLGITDGVGPTEEPRLDPRPAALLMFHPERWAVLAGHVVPLLARMPVVAGVGNVRLRNRKTGELSITAARTEREKRGWVVLMPDFEAPGTGISYLHTPCRGVYLTRWETAHAGSSIVSTDLPGYVRWLRDLIDRGLLPRPKPYVLERIAAQLRQQVLELQDRVRTVPSAQVDLDRKLADLAVVEVELGGRPLIPVPKRPAGLDGVTDDTDTDDQE